MVSTVRLYLVLRLVRIWKKQKCVIQTYAKVPFSENSSIFEKTGFPNLSKSATFDPILQWPHSAMISIHLVDS